MDNEELESRLGSLEIAIQRIEEQNFKAEIAELKAEIERLERRIDEC